MPELTRRKFLKTTGAAAGMAAATTSCAHASQAATVAPGISDPRSFAANERIRLGVIGTGGQGCKHIEYGIAGTPKLQLSAICDVYRRHREFAMRLIDVNYPENESEAVKQYADDYREMLDKEQLDAIVICTPSDLHHAMVMECLDRGLAVFCEKPLALTVKHAREIVKKCHETGGFCQVGHQRRYNPMYNKAVWYARESPYIGRINHVTAQWHRNNDWRRWVDPDYKLDAIEAKYIHDLDRHLNWRLYPERSGGMVMELGTHQIDVATWFLGAPPARVVGLGGVDYWFDGRHVNDNASVVFEYDIRRSAPAFRPVMVRTEHQDKHMNAQPYQARFEYSLVSANAWRGASEVIHGESGTLEVSEARGGRIFAEHAPVADRDQLVRSLIKQAGSPVPMEATRESQAPPELFSDGIPVTILEKEGSGQVLHLDQRLLDRVQFESFAKDIVDGNVPKANAYVGLLAVASAVAANRAVRERRMVEIEPASLAFDFEVPEAYRYDYFPSPRISDDCPLQFPPPTVSHRS